MKKTLSFLLVISMFCVGATKVNAQKVISTAGSFIENNYGSLSWTLGEIAVETISNTDLILTQGFQQSKLTVTGINIIPLIEPDVKAFPNPSADYVNIKVGNAMKVGDWQYALFDQNGKKLIDKKLYSDFTKVSLGTLPDAIYFLRVSGGGYGTRIFKIVKQ